MGRSVAATVALLVLLIAVDAHAGWRKVASENGVTAHMRENRRSGLPVIRVRTKIKANIALVLAVIMDVGSSCKWAGRCLEARIVKSDGPFKHRVYSRRAGPWPVSDRDFELESRTRIRSRGRRVLVKFWAARKPTVPPVPGVVRMTVMRGHYKLRRLGPKLTHFEFEVEADPGGLIPRWVVRWTAKAGPMESARRLRDWVPSVKGRYADFLKRYAKMSSKRRSKTHPGSKTFRSSKTYRSSKTRSH